MASMKASSSIKDKESGYISHESPGGIIGVKKRTAQHIRDADLVHEDLEKSLPQGFRAGQLRRRGHRFCLRHCGKQFSTKDLEEDHYRIPGKCNHFPTTKRSTFDPSQIPVVRGLVGRQQLRAFTQAFIEVQEEKNRDAAAQEQAEGFSSRPTSVDEW